MYTFLLGFRGWSRHKLCKTGAVIIFKIEILEDKASDIKNVSLDVICIFVESQCNFLNSMCLFDFGGV